MILQLGDHALIKIESVALGGEGVGRIDNVVTFVPFSAPGDELEIEITQMKKKFVRGKILKIIKQSPQRVNPLCRYYEKCGGCCYQHLNYEYQLAIKKKQVWESFWKIGKIANPQIQEAIASPRVYNYRGKAQYHEKLISDKKIIGFLDISGGKIVDIENCEIMDETINEKMRILREDKKRKHSEKELTIWSDYSTGEVIEKETITRVVKEKIFLAPREGFFQTNLYLTDVLVDEVCRLAGSNEIADTIIDAYCGSGLFSIFLSSFAKNVIGIEINEKSIEYAGINAGNAGVQNAKFIHGDVDTVLMQKNYKSGGKVDILILDPPRSGCKNSTLMSAIDLQPGKIIYVSCNPATQARDIQFLNERGYNLRSLLPVDMFPQTEHIEVVGFLELK